jgi:hypothetical protein
MTQIIELSAPQPGGVRILELPNATSFEPPSERQFKLLLDLVFATHQEHRKFAEKADDFQDEAWRAFAAIGYMYRTREPDTTRYFSAHVEDVNEVIARRWRARAVSGPAVFVAVVAHGDVAWRAHDRRVGQPLEIGLDQFSGVECSNVWRKLLEGQPLRAPLPPREIFRSSAAPSPVTVFRQQPPAGPWTDVSGSDGPLW